jgi:hypothetical protein
LIDEATPEWRKPSRWEGVHPMACRSFPRQIIGGNQV